MEPAPVEATGNSASPRMSRAPRGLTRERYALYCDEYELTMAQSFWLHGQNERVCFEMSVRHLPGQRGYLVVAGVEQVLAQLGTLRFTADDVERLAATGAYREDFLAFLGGVRFTGDAHAIPEGTVIGAATPLLRVTAPRIEATLVESALLAIINHQTSIASKTARIVTAARGLPVWDFSLRRVHGPEAGLGVARAAYIAGAAGTATVVAGARLGIPTAGTMAHHYVMAFGPEHEQASFEQFLRDYPGRSILLIDTYDTVHGAELALAASRATGVPLGGVRLDSGDIGALARSVRGLFDAAGMNDVRIFASGDLDETRIEELLTAGAPVDGFGVGTMLGTSYDAPALGGVYKLVAQREDGVMRPVIKRSTDKVSEPGVHQVFRTPTGDVVGLEDEPVDGEPLLAPVMAGGRSSPVPSLAAIRERCAAQLERVPAAQRRLHDPTPWPVRRSAGLRALRGALGVVDGEGPA